MKKKYNYESFLAIFFLIHIGLMYGVELCAKEIIKKNRFHDELQLNLQGEAYSALRADLIIYSFDRPMQLYALLESVQSYITGISSTCVIYRATDERFSNAYQKVFKDFSSVKYIKQGKNPEQDFKPLTIHALETSQNPYVIFAVDDIVVKDFIALDDDITLLESTGAYGFYYRLGKNLDACYSYESSQKLPSLVEISPEICSWQFIVGECDWRYPNNLDMTLYRKKDIISDICRMDYHSPNTFEGQWSARADCVLRRIGLCYNVSKIVNLPLNIVQKDWKNRAMDFHNPEQLLTFFNRGLKIDIQPLFRIDNKAAHMEYDPTFVNR